uniref:3-phytase n=1 Tax=Cyanothece sp. (strain PCC 7425 / ATCC 29141) TaxID=395961 RepID=B8HQM4_CYAP4
MKKTLSRAWLSVVLSTATLVPLISQAQPTAVSVKPKLETPPLFDDDAGGEADADDPAIWLHPTRAAKSLIVATKKNAGLSVYDLQAREVQAIPAPPGSTAAPGRFNNVDLIYNFGLNSQKVDLAVVSDRGSDRLKVYKIDPSQASQPLTDITIANPPFIFSRNQAQVDDQRTAYGIATYRNRLTGKTYAFVSQRERTKVAQLELLDAGQGKVSYRKIRELVLPSRFTLPNGKTWIPCNDPGNLPQVEGMVVDEETKQLYMGQEDVGIWKVSLARFGQNSPILLDRVREYGVPYTYDQAEEECIYNYNADPGFGSRYLQADVEGLTIYYAAGNRGYLLVSSQGNNTFAIYDRRSTINRYLGSFGLVNAGRVDGVQESDGAAVLNVPLGSSFPFGLLVTQDGDNKPDVPGPDGEPRPNTNFKYTPWQSVANAFPRKLSVTPFGWHPRTGYKP